MKTVVIFFGLLALVKGQSSEVTPCTWFSGSPVPINTYVEGCTTSPCRIVRGDTAAIHIVFRAPYTIRSMTTLATAFIVIPIPYPLGEDAITCNHLTNTYCPVLENEVVAYTLQLTVDEAWPIITVPIEFRIMDDQNTAIMCLRMNVAVAATARTGGNSTLTLN